MASPVMGSPLALSEGHCVTPDTFDDGHALYQAVRAQGLEGVVAKRPACGAQIPANNEIPPLGDARAPA